MRHLGGEAAIKLQESSQRHSPMGKFISLLIPWVVSCFPLVYVLRWQILAVSQRVIVFFWQWLFYEPELVLITRMRCFNVHLDVKSHPSIVRFLALLSGIRKALGQIWVFWLEMVRSCLIIFNTRMDQHRWAPGLQISARFFQTLVAEASKNGFGHLVEDPLLRLLLRKIELGQG